MTSQINRQYQLAQRPSGLPGRDTFSFVEPPLGEPAEGQILVKNEYLSLDPAMRERMLGLLHDAMHQRHRNVDDTPAGGGAGMVIRPDVMAAALREAKSAAPDLPVVYLSPRGRPLTQAIARRLAQGPGVTLICGRFEGVDQRVLDAFDVTEISIGDYVLTGGEIAAQVLIDATVRLIPRVLGNQESLAEESFSHGLLEHPQYTKPAEWEGRRIPDVLLSGNHAAISHWRDEEAERLTKERRPDLWRAYRDGMDPNQRTQLSGASDQSRNHREHDEDQSR